VTDAVRSEAAIWRRKEKRRRKGGKKPIHLSKGRVLKVYKKLGKNNLRGKK